MRPRRSVRITRDNTCGLPTAGLACGQGSATVPFLPPPCPRSLCYPTHTCSAPSSIQPFGPRSLPALASPPTARALQTELPTLEPRRRRLGSAGDLTQLQGTPHLPSRQCNREEMNFSPHGHLLSEAQKSRHWALACRVHLPGCLSREETSALNTHTCTHALVPRHLHTLTCTYVLFLGDTREHCPHHWLLGQRTTCQKGQRGEPSFNLAAALQNWGVCGLSVSHSSLSSLSPPAWPSGPPRPHRFPPTPFLVSGPIGLPAGLLSAGSHPGGGGGREPFFLFSCWIHGRRYLPPVPGARGQPGMCAWLGALTGMGTRHMPWHLPWCVHGLSTASLTPRDAGFPWPLPHFPRPGWTPELQLLPEEPGSRPC